MEEFHDYMPLKQAEKEVKLGKKPGVVKDPRTFSLRTLVDRPLSVPAESYVGKGEPIRYYANDRYGDCTCAAMGHRIDVQERSSLQNDIQLTDEDVLGVYSAVTGFDLSKPETDNGAYMLDVLNYMRNTGMGHEEDGTPHTIYAFADFDQADKAMWKYASWIFGTVYAGIWLPLSASDQISRGERWHLSKDPTDRDKPGSWGGHAVSAVGYSAGSAVIATWGRRIRADWAWLAKYCDEAYAVISEDFIRSSGKTRAGFNVSQLESMLANI